MSFFFFFKMQVTDETRAKNRRKKLTCLFPVKYYLRKKKREKQLKRSQCFRGRLVWIKGKNGKRWNLGNINDSFFLRCK